MFQLIYQILYHILELLFTYQTSTYTYPTFLRTKSERLVFLTHLALHNSENNWLKGVCYGGTSILNLLAQSMQVSVTAMATKMGEPEVLKPRKHQSGM